MKKVEEIRKRMTKRICHKATDISWLSEQKWPGLQSIFAIERIVENHGHCNEETSYYISSRDASPRQLMEFAREHWEIESMHWMLDVTFSEDSCHFLSENAHKTLNSLRKFALAVHKQFLSACHINSSLKSSMLSALLRPDYFRNILLFL